MTFGDSCRDCIVKGLCSGDCCGPVSIPVLIWNQYKDKITQEYSQLIQTRDEVTPISSNGSCVFLDQSKKCVIYSDRPKICKDYGTIPELLCPHLKMNGNLRSEANSKHVQRKINHFVDDTMKEIGKRA